MSRSTTSTPAPSARSSAAGGAKRHGAIDVPGTLRFSGVADPQGAPFVVYTGLQPGGPPRGEAGEAGYGGWHELMATDGAAAFDFYAGLFGWTKTGVFDMGPMGAYQLWTDGRGYDAGGMMTRPDSASEWRFYFRVDGIDAAIERLEAAGGALANGPFQVPTGDWVLQATDPQGASFHLMSRAR